jgi:predicted ATPase
MGRRGERVVDALLASRQNGAYISPGRKKKRQTLEQRVAYWLKELGLIHDFTVERIAQGNNLYEVRVRKTIASTDVLITDVGFGVSQVLPVLVLCYYVPEGSVILLEQPEIHLHPSVQSRLADVFIDAMKNRNVQIIVESHSEHLLRRLQRRVADETIKPEDTALYFSEVGDTGSTLTSLEVDLFGSIKNWPKDFFGDEFGEMAEITKAAMLRKQAE